MAELDFVLSVGVPLALLFVGWYFGRRAEQTHYQSIKEREKRFLAQPAVTTRQAPDTRAVVRSELAVGSVVISIDHFKRLLSVFRLLFGGELYSFSPLIDRGRREAILRMKESCPDADAYLNCRLETSTISNSTGRDATGTVEVMCYATAVKFAPTLPDSAGDTALGHP